MTIQAEVTSFSGFWRSFRRNRMGVVGLAMLLLAIGMAVFAPELAPYDPKAPVKVTIDDIYARPAASTCWARTTPARTCCPTSSTARASP